MTIFFGRDIIPYLIMANCPEILNMALDPRILNYFKLRPATTLWEMLLDKNHQQKGPTCFEESEPGYLKSMFHALDYLFSTLGTPVTPDYILALHTHAIDNTLLRQTYSTENETIFHSIEPFTKGFRKNTGTEFGLITSGEEQNCSEAGFVELLEKLEKGDIYFYIDVRTSTGEHLKILSSTSHNIPVDKSAKKALFETLRSNESQLLFSIRATDSTTIKARITTILDQYYRDLGLALDDSTRIRAIAVCIHELEITHSFYDGNGRSNMLMLLNKLLLENNLSPAILRYADRFDAFSADELCDDIKNGQEIFKDNTLARAPEGVLLHLKDNKSLTQLVAYQIACSMPTYVDVAEDQKTQIINLITQVLEHYPFQSFEYEQLEILTANVKQCLVDAEKTLNPVCVHIEKFKENLNSKHLLPVEPNCLTSFLSRLLWVTTNVPVVTEQTQSKLNV